MREFQEIFEEQNKLPHLYIGEVVDINDPLLRNRVRVRIVGLTDDSVPDNECPWAEQGTAIFSGTSVISGFSSVPDKGSFVYIQFLYGSPHHPIYTNYVRGAKDISPQAKSDYPYNQVIHTKSGHQIEFNDKSKYLKIKCQSGSNILFKANGDIVINQKNRTSVINGDETITANNRNITATTNHTGNIIVNGDVIANGISLVNHTHTGDSGGTTSPPS